MSKYTVSLKHEAIIMHPTELVSLITSCAVDLFPISQLNLLFRISFAFPYVIWLYMSVVLL